ncbi:two component transcriptional regulator, winged helix family [Ancylobacter novellus DSM 506]|jgi:DNA-binding response OmpR family regulator|uniref:Cell cycle response regulator CtrA n=1 Tax=Ancylobacter novellus (strain ATCC 8093 / DSM 506 / JCM 20403 / CCM 1077 / IAM 12100 / NBRC 12443 / NCIMB 10456) TaxID=639283 RepID=D7A6Z9_ANCN5|nr:response regulator transcription factor [Ancylobacter novellus]ADH88373.1 two component transcriptional regulator, winged helix family [Ancylobacter novellus DSM 506]
MTILIVEDDPDIGSLLRRGFSSESYQVELVGDGEEALRAANGKAWEAIILDVMLPGRSGIEVCKALRAGGQTAPIIMLSARSSVNERTEGLMAGADDYIIKPFAFEELLARLKVQALRRSNADSEPRVLTAGPLSLDLDTRQAQLAGTRVRLTEREVELLALLMRHPSEPLARADIFAALWAGHGGASLNVVDVYVGYLRHKLAEALPDGGHMIVTVRGRGFMFDPEPG